MPKGKGSQDQDDIVFEEEGTSAGLELKKLKEKLKECQKQRDEYLVGWQRARAELVNARKEDEKHKSEFKKFATASLIDDLLSIADSFEMAFKDEGWQKLDKTWRDGINYLYNQFINVLKEHNLEPIEAKGKKFNPKEHEAIGEINVADVKEEGVVIKEVRKGYKLHNKVLRPAQVKVGKYSKSN